MNLNILIVDDNEMNRMVIKGYVEHYIGTHTNISFNIQEACDGIEATQICDIQSFDMIFMDIMMPNLNGIDATRMIKTKDKNVMIIAISALNESSQKESMLNSGAEDYITKPIEMDMFCKRLENYIAIIESRNSKKYNSKQLNLFSNEIYRRHTKFIIDSKDALSEFWEFFLLNPRYKYDNVSDVVRTIYLLATFQLKEGLQSSIYIEESDKIQYFTLTHLDTLPMSVMNIIIKKNNLTQKYHIKDGKFSCALEKKFSYKPDSVLENEILPPALLRRTSNELQVFNYMYKEDLHELEEYTSKLNSLMLLVGNGDLNEDEAIEISAYLRGISEILSSYSEVYAVSKALYSLCEDISAYTSEFISNSEALGPMCNAFSKDISKWIDMSFYSGAPSIDFMNDTIIVNCQTISSMIKRDELETDEEDLDGIFDF